MDPEKRRAIASKGGKAAHIKGTAHQFIKEEAAIAGRKGGIEAHRRGTAHRFTNKNKLIKEIDAYLSNLSEDDSVERGYKIQVATDLLNYRNILANNSSPEEIPPPDNSTEEPSHEATSGTTGVEGVPESNL